jgi:DNA-binding protein HU-beta
MAKKGTPKTKGEIMDAIAEATGITKKQAGIAYDTLLAVAYAGAKEPKGIMLPGLGKLIKVKRAARMGINPATKEKIKIPAKTVAKFRLAKAAKDAVLK